MSQDTGPDTSVDKRSVSITLDDTAPESHQDLARVLLGLDDQRRALKRTGNTEILAAGAVALAELRKALSQLERDTKSDVAELMREDDTQRLIVGNRVVERSRTSPTWHYDSDEILKRVMLVALTRQYGSVIPDEVMGATGVIIDALRDCLPLTATGIAWRMGTATTEGLRDYIDKDLVDQLRTMKREPRDTVSVK